MKPLFNIAVVVVCLLLHADASAQGVIKTIAGNGVTQYIGDGWPATSYSLALPKGICVDKNGIVYAADYFDFRIRKIENDTLFTIGGTGMPGHTGDNGPASAATFGNATGMAIDTSGNLYISEEGNNDIRKIDRLTGIVHTICGNGGGGYYGDNGPATDAHMELPAGICVDRAGNVYIADYGNQRVRKINVATGMISTFAGNGISGYTGDNGAATAAELSYPKAVCADTAGNIYIADYGNNCIRKVNAATGAITTFAGITTAGYYGDNGPAVNAALRQPNALFMSKQGNLFISDWGNNVIRAVSRAGNIYTVAGTGAVGYTGDNGPALDATFRGPLALCSDDAGYLYIADGESSAIRRVSPIAVGIQELEQHLKVTVYPNPSQGKFTVYTGQAADATLTLYNDMGQVTYTARCNDERTFVDASNLSPGVYFLNFTAADKRITQKIIINP